ncbi:hypothetical protein Clacol_007253 [Clathrus columnatus]|uniref:Probable RNA-binding protein 18 n=1 Tax=Clathrus columnatus TaxID=1419009 RepID=A0AAV5AEE6_9AGAM|nr:hypothetical protein Clacol_007253 [Clathrus columnatus]
MSADNNQFSPAPGSSSGSGLDLKSSESNLITYPAEDPPSPSPPPSMPAQPQILKDRLYVGNLHPTVDEYVLAQLFSKYGKISKMDFLFHKSGPQKGKPRGYAFIEFSIQDSAINALAALNDKLLRGRRMVVTFAHQAPQTDMSYPLKRSTDTSKPTTLSLLKGQGKPAATKDRIAALEAKLRQMEEQSSQIQVQVHAQPPSVSSDSTSVSGPGFSKSLPPRPLLSAPLSQPITILPSSLPSKPLVSTMPTVPSDGAQRKPGVGSGPNIRPSSKLLTPISNSSRDHRCISTSTSTSNSITRTMNPSKPLLPQRYTTNSLGIVIKR